MKKNTSSRLIATFRKMEVGDSFVYIGIPSAVHASAKSIGCAVVVRELNSIEKSNQLKLGVWLKSLPAKPKRTACAFPISKGIPVPPSKAGRKVGVPTWNIPQVEV